MGTKHEPEDKASTYAHTNNSNGTAAPSTHSGLTTTRPRKARWRNITENFTAAWYTIVMNTGVLGILYHNQPYQFTGLKTIAVVLYVFAIFLFCLFSIPTILRWTLFYEQTAKKTQGNIDEISMLGAPAIAWTQVTALTALVVSNAEWGHSFSVVAVVMWWFGTVWVVTTCVGVCVDIFAYEVAYDRTLSPALFLPCVAVATDAVVGAVICRYGHDVSARLAVPILIMNYLLDGLAIFISLEIYTIYFHRLMATGWPESPKLPGLMLLVGPFGQVGAALLLTGSAASTRMDFEHYDKGTFLTMAGGETAAAVGVILALLFLGHDLFWLLVAICGIGKGFIKHEHTYTLLWQAMIFPVATVTTTFISLSVEMNSPTFRTLAAIFTVYLTIAYLINWGFILWYSIKGNLLIKPEPISETKSDTNGVKAD